MRAAFVATLAELAESDDRIILLTADLGFSVVEPFADLFPDRFFNVGVAETNMVALATGLAHEGLLPFCYSIASFLSMRCYEAFRDGPIAHGSPVRLVAVGGGVGYGVSGITHYAVEDIAIMRTSQRVAIYAPPTTTACTGLLRKTYTDPAPIYYRLAKDALEDRRVPADRLALDGYVIIGTSGIPIITYGRMATIVLDAIERLAHSHALAFQCVVVQHLHPDVVGQALAAFTDSTDLVSVEDHVPIGGLGSLIAERFASLPRHPRLHRLGIGTDIWEGRGGSEMRVLARNGLAAEELCTGLRNLARQGHRRC